MGVGTKIVVECTTDGIPAGATMHIMRAVSGESGMEIKINRDSVKRPL